LQQFETNWGESKMKDIVVIAPIENIYTTALDIVRHQDYDNVEVVMGSMSEGVTMAKWVVEQGAKIIVTRGGTYQLVKEAFRIPAVEIKVDAYDIVETYSKIPDHVDKIAVVGYDNVVYGFDVIKDLINKEIKIIELQNEQETHEIILAHMHGGIFNYIGDANIVKVVKKLGCNGWVIQSRRDTIHTAIKEANQILSASLEEKRRVQQMVITTDFIHDGVVSIDENGYIVIFNKRAEEIFGISKAKAIGKKSKSILPAIKLWKVLNDGKPRLSEVQQVSGVTITINCVPIIVDEKVKGAVATFQEITELQRMERSIRRKLNDKGFVAKHTFKDIVYRSKIMADRIKTARKYAKYDTPVHLCGPSGVGKELFCQSIHNASPRASGPFVAINCAAIAPSLIESELFGYVEGSFTGASRKGKMGIFELAHGGTLFLDEISELPLDFQSRLLRVLQEKEVIRVGGSKLIPVDVRIITASNRYLGGMVDEGLFRRDLFFRINILTLRIPALSERPEDIPVLAEMLLKKYADKYGVPQPEISPQVMDALMKYNYSGNVRELEGIAEKAVILGGFDEFLRKDGPRRTETSKGKRDIKHLELVTMHKTLEETGGNMQKTAELLGISRTTLWRRLNRH